MLKTIAVAVLPALLLLFSAGVQVHAQESDTESIYSAVYDALNQGDVDGALEHFAEDAVSTRLPPPPGTDTTSIGPEAIRQVFDPLVAQGGHWTLSDFHVHGDAATFTAHFQMDDIFAGQGVYPLEFYGTAIIQDDLIRSESWSMNPNSLSRIQRAATLQANKDLVRRFYDNFWNEGDMAAADEIVAVDFIDRFTGQDGSDALKDIVGIFHAAFPDFQVAYTDMMAEDDVVVVSVEAAGTYAGGAPEFLGIPDSVIGERVIIFSGVDFARIEDGQIAEGWGTHDVLRTLTGYGYEVVPPIE